jgi:hypothetical protein
MMQKMNIVGSNASIRSISSSNGNEEDNYALLMMYKDYTMLMHIASKKTYSFYYKLKLFLTVSNLILSAASSAIDAAYMNTTTLEPAKLEGRTLFGLSVIIKSGMVINFVLCITMGFLYLFEIAQKELYHKIYADNYLRLNNAIMAEVSLNKAIHKDFIKFIVFEFTFLIENNKYDIPTFIKRRIKKYYSQYNIPPYIDMYINNFKGLGLFSKFKKWLNKCECDKAEVNTVSPVMKQYSFDSQYNYMYDSKIIAYNKNEDYTDNASNVSSALCKVKIIEGA